MYTYMRTYIYAILDTIEVHIFGSLRTKLPFITIVYQTTTNASKNTFEIYLNLYQHLREEKTRYLFLRDLSVPLKSARWNQSRGPLLPAYCSPTAEY